MNIKDPSSATKNKIFLGFWFVIFATLILLVNWLMQIPAYNAEQLVTRLADSEKHMTKLSALHAVFLVSNDRKDNLFTRTENNIEQDCRQTIIRINDHITAIGNAGTIKRKDAITGLLKDFTNEITAYEASLNNLVLITRERGNKNSGLIFNWRDRSNRMLSANAGGNDQSNDMLNRMRQLEGEYILSGDPKILKDISIIAEEIRSSLSEESLISLDDIDSYLTITGHLLSIEKRLGYEGVEGIIPDLEKALQNMPEVFNTLRQMITIKVDVIRRNWTIARFMVIILIIALFIFVFVNGFSLLEPLRKIAGYAGRMESGEFPEEDIATGNIMDLKSIKESMKRHIALLQQKYLFTRDLNQDKMETTLITAGENDLLGNELISLQNKIVENYEKQRQNEQDNIVRQYMNEGVAKFADILRQKNESIHILGDAFIREIVKYLNSIQGGFFILDDTEPSDPVLRLVSAFAYNRKKYLDQVVKYGEGLIGTCAREKQFINLTDIPPGYIAITSGLGDTPPNNLLLIPVLHENELLGVIEIASLNKFRDYEIEFTREVALNLGSTLVNTRNNQRTSELLAKSQQQALEMAEQEEEMRQNMEELKATQEESGRREEEFRGIVEAIGNTLLLMEYSLDGKITNVNNAMCLFIGKDREELIGKTHQEAFGSTIITDEKFWENLNSNSPLVFSETVKIGKKTFEILEHFAIVPDRNNVTVKYINFATNGRTRNS
jgi:PAS domain S-box-containing protein